MSRYKTITISDRRMSGPKWLRRLRRWWHREREEQRVLREERLWREAQERKAYNEF